MGGKAEGRDERVGKNQQGRAGRRLSRVVVERALDGESGTSIQHRLYFYDPAQPLTFQDLIFFTYKIGI